ncbi:putative dehydrogenase [Paenibacillus taihuensis]|uniref:Putative dehydrogenase n=1 Tax=Paenibacillus taihuensis TaxID=1156355 RepID=A0A3D9RH83_9BACL|nr:ThuA domain-containing protein [Paenibacillus taihuensis]REE77691.1 putative dehydrogenase [Paenibacillus taihuensis]
MKVFLLGGGMMVTETTPLVQQYLSEAGYEVYSTEVAEDMATEHFVTSDILVMNSCQWTGSGHSLSDISRAALEKHTQAGKGIVVLHCSIGNWDDWPEYIRYTGGVWNWERSKHGPADQNFTVEVTRRHPLVEGIPDQFSVSDEMYYDLDMAEGNTILASTSQETGSHPMIWYRRIQQSDVAAIMLGHDAESCFNPYYKQFILNACSWVTRGERRRMTYKVGIIGCGRPQAGVNANKEGFSVAYNHGRAFTENPNTVIAAISDISEENAQVFAEEYNVTSTYSDYKLMLKREKLDIVSICTWPNLHKEMTIEAARAGVKMILCEKPMAVGVDEIDEMIQECQMHGARLYVNHQRRYEGTFSGVKQMIDDGHLGAVLRMEAWVGDGWDLMSWGTHWVDMHRYFMNDMEVKWVLAQGIFSGKQRYGHEVEDHLMIQMQYENGVLGHIHLGSHLEGAGVIVNCEKGTVRIGEQVTLIVNDECRSEELKKQYLFRRPSGYYEGFAEMLGEILTAYEEGALTGLEGVNGHKTTEIIMAAYYSAKFRTMVHLPMKDRDFTIRAERIASYVSH